jgi:hypothetical protein
MHSYLKCNKELNINPHPSVGRKKNKKKPRVLLQLQILAIHRISKLQLLPLLPWFRLQPLFQRNPLWVVSRHSLDTLNLGQEANPYQTSLDWIQATLPTTQTSFGVITPKLPLPTIEDKKALTRIRTTP